MEAVAILFLLLAPVSEASTAEPITYADLVTRLTDLQRLAYTDCTRREDVCFDQSRSRHVV